MSKACRESGAALVMIIGVAAALAVLAMAVTALTVNAMRNTSRDRQQIKTFDVAEGVLDHSMAQLARSWPADSSLSPTFVASDFTTRYQAEGLLSQYPDLEVQASFYDDRDTNGDGYINELDEAWDTNGNGLVFVEVQAQANERATRLRALVQQQTISPGVPEGVAFYTQAQLWTHGGSIAIGIDDGYGPPSGIQVKGYAGDPTQESYRNDGQVRFDPDVGVYIAGPPDPGQRYPDNVAFEQPVPSFDEMVNPTILAALRSMASVGNYYTNVGDLSGHGFRRSVSTDPESISPNPPDTSLDDLSGLVYIDTDGDASLQIHDQFNTPEHPGILVVDAATLRLTGGGDYYGLIIVLGGAVDLGTVAVHGAVICRGPAMSELGGDQCILYNHRVWSSLQQSITVATRIVPNSWRELPTQ